MKGVEHGYVVCCPKCGVRASVSDVGIDYHHCRNCAVNFGGWVISGFVITYLVDEEGWKKEDYVKRLTQCAKKLTELSRLGAVETE